MKNQSGFPSLGSKRNSLCIFYVIAIVYFFCFKNSFVGNFCTELKPTYFQLADFPWVELF